MQYTRQKLVTIVTLGGQTTVAATLLYCVMTCAPVTVWPAQSVAFQVRVITFEHVEVGLLCVWFVVTVSAVPLLSFPVTVGAVGISLTHCTVVLAGTPLKVGGAVKIVAV